MSAVWRMNITPPTRKLVLLALADYGDDRGGNIFPSMSALAAKCGVTRSQAQRHVRALEVEGLVRVVANASGGKPGATPHYRLDLDQVVHTARTSETGSADATGSTDAQEGPHGRAGGVAPMRETGSADATQTTINHQRTINNHHDADEVAVLDVRKKTANNTLSSGFDEFWQAYPDCRWKHTTKAQEEALAAWRKFKIARNVETPLKIMMDIPQRLNSSQWQAEGGRFIPAPKTYLTNLTWLKPIPPPDNSEAAETPWQRSRRELVEQLTGGLVSRKPRGRPVIDVHAAFNVPDSATTAAQMAELARPELKPTEESRATAAELRARCGLPPARTGE
jgi:hypothetical protein